MTILFDHNLAIRLRRSLLRHVVRTCHQMTWDRLRNGDLLRVAEQAGFDLFVTCDRNLEYQQNLAGRKIAIVVLTRVKWNDVEAHLPEVLAAIEAATPGSFQVVDCHFHG